LVSAGIENFNLDLMYGLPRQSVAQALADVRAAIQLQPSHISHYQLTLEPGTVFHHRPPAALPDEDATWEMQVECQQQLAAAGYSQYEVSAYAQAGRQCRHNLNYWQFGDYLGIGAGAHGKLTDAPGGAIVRTTRQRQPREYLQRAAAERRELQSIESRARAFEFMLNALRLLQGFSLREFETRTGLPLAAIDTQLSAALAKGLLVAADSTHYRPTDLGIRFLNDLQSIFLERSG
jgi:putative oxygen-independent coproporphyrinogen III oxidase